MANYQEFLNPLLAEGLNKVPEDEYRAKMKAMEALVGQANEEKQAATINAGEGQAFGKAVDTAMAPTMGVGNALLGVKPTNYSNAAGILNAYQGSRETASTNKLKDLLDAYKTSISGENVAQDYGKQRTDALGKGAGLEAGLMEAREKGKKKLAMDFTPGQKAQDIAVGKEKADYDLFGGFAEVYSQLNTLKGLNNDLKKGNIESGGVVNKYITSKYPGSELYIAKQKIAQAAQNTMRPILGAAFTENEGKRIIENAFDPGVGPEENARRIDELITKLERIDAAKREAFDYFDEHGTVVGMPHETFAKLKADLAKDAGVTYAGENERAVDKMAEAKPSREQMIQNIKKKLAGG